MSKTILEKYTAKLKIIHEKAKKSKELLKYWISNAGQFPIDCLLHLDN